MSKISRKLLRQADEQARLAEKIFNYRCDVLEASRREALRANIDKVEELKDDRELADEAVLRDAMAALEVEMKASGGSFYPKSGLTENVEVMLVAAILAICIRMFFVQPFRIPTNSMYPTYDGMTYELFATPQDEPGILETAFRTVTLCSSRVTLKAPVDGEVVIPVFPTSLGPDGYAMIPKAVAARKWFGILPTTNARFSSLVGEEAGRCRCGGLPLPGREDRVGAFRCAGP
jgi:signal peptidase I